MNAVDTNVLIYACDSGGYPRISDPGSTQSGMSDFA